MYENGRQAEIEQNVFNLCGVQKGELRQRTEWWLPGAEPVTLVSVDRKL